MIHLLQFVPIFRRNGRQMWVSMALKWHKLQRGSSADAAVYGDWLPYVRRVHIGVLLQRMEKKISRKMQLFRRHAEKIDREGINTATPGHNDTTIDLF